MREFTCWSDGTPILRGNVTDPWGRRADERWVRVMAEISSPGLWDVSGCARLPEGLPISAALQARIAAWQDWHDRLDAANDSFPDPHYWEQRSDAPTEAFNAEGRAIGRALKAELPDDWTVIVRDVDAWLRPAPELILRSGGRNE